MCFVIQCVQGSLSKYVKDEGCLNEMTAGLFTKQILCGLHYLHRLNIIHRDIKGYVMYDALTVRTVMKRINFVPMQAILCNLYYFVTQLSVTIADVFWSTGENVLLNADHSVVKLTDFGISKQLGRSQQTVTVLHRGTDYYMSPEILGGSRYGTKTDIWCVWKMIFLRLEKR
jgi:serine/threonine protein kinase